jgi:polyhydroxyalkanoate synthesis repressor PhaR
VNQDQGNSFPKEDSMYNIKRYPNRKLYDTRRNKYVILSEISELIRQGEEISVIDNVSGEDITTVTLTQIILEREKRVGNFLPRKILSDLIEAGGESISSIRKKIVPPTELLQQVDEEISKRIQGLIQQGEIAEDYAKKLHAMLFQNSLLKGSLSLVTQQEIQEALTKHDLPSRDEFQDLIKQIDSLAEKIEKMK